MNLDIIFEDKYILIVKKPYGIASQKDKTCNEGMIDIADEYLKNNKDKNYAVLVHRLDRPVGGIMIFAKGNNSASIISEQIKNQEFKKKYLAVVCGSPKKEGTFCDYILKNERLNLSKVVPKKTKTSKLAQLEYKIINSIDTEEYGVLSLVEINLLTGRHHQIRVQFSNAGFPLLGDKKYNNKIKPIGKTTIALWSYQIEFKHPFNDKILSFKLKPDNILGFNFFENTINI